ncbi:DUF4328 domain-containing protein [Embleya sp. NBC_00896]|uniref:DUF4328 domain-containing protein n=1 Tax=Embleya sp. NBC_00896 TaxID=2975961 RepID=UPI002F914EED|nr:DUF4328 domain-containing protein [Embleya sp. NBC_00896]
MPHPRPLRGLAIALYVLLGVHAALSVFDGIWLLERAFQWDDIARDRTPGGDPHNTGEAVTLLWRLSAIPYLALIVVFLIWFHHARANIDTYPDRRTRTLSPGWSIGGWFCPVVNLWFPMLITRDIWRASDPHPPHPEASTRGGLPLVWAWWATFVSVVPLYAYVRYVRPDGEPDISSDTFDPIAHAEASRTADIALACGYLILTISAGLLVAVIARITGFQTEREHRMAATQFRPPHYAPTPPTLRHPTAEAIAPARLPDAPQPPPRPQHPPTPQTTPPS